MSASQPSGQPTQRVPMPRWLWVAIGTASRASADLLVVEAPLGQAFAGDAGDHLLGAGAGGHSLGLDPGEGAGAPLGGDRGAEQGVDLLRLLAGDRRRDRLRVTGSDRDLRAQAALALANAFGDVGGEGLGVEGGFAEDYLVDRLPDDLLEARHVDAGLLRVEVDEALHLGEVEVLGAVDLDADHLLDPGDADPREADLGRRGRGLDVRCGRGEGGCFGGHRS